MSPALHHSRFSFFEPALAGPQAYRERFHMFYLLRRVLALAIVLSFSTHLLAATVDSDDVVVTAARVAQSRDAVIGDVSVIDRETIERAGQSTLVELLQTQPGIEITNNGGYGKLSGIFMRGTNSDHVLVLIDGIRVNSATAGTTTFENLPVALIDRVEILRGPATSLYGQDAIGGVIQIFTRRGQGEPRFFANLGYGSYNNRTAEAGVHGAMGDTRFALAVSSQDIDGFSALRTSNPNLDDDDGYRNLSFTGSASHQIAAGHEIGVQYLRSKGHTRFDSSSNIRSFFGIPNAFDPGFSDHANITQQSVGITSRNQFHELWLSTIKIGEGLDRYETFSATGPFIPESRSLFETRQRQYSWQNDIQLPAGTLTLIYDRLEERVHATEDFNEDARNNDGYVAGYLLDVGAHTFQINYRSDHNSSFGTNDTGGIAYGFRFNERWRATASFGTAFKAPTFNDLYYPALGGFATSNPDLRPEKSRNIEAGLHFRTDQSHASMTLYQNEIRDLIALDQNFLPQNIKEAKIRGMTLGGGLQAGAWRLGGSLDLQSPEDRETGNLLARRANRHASLNLSRNWDRWRFGGEILASSQRYNDEANTQRLDGYALLNLTADYTINQDWRLQGRINNLLDKDYALAFDGNPNAGGFVYDTPGSNLFFSLRYEPK